MSDVEKVAAVEALLFLYGEALSAEKMGSFLKISTQAAMEACSALAQQCADEHRGLQVVEKNGLYQLVTKPQFGAFLEEFVKESLKEELTSAALETLSLVAYFGPVTRAHIDFVRGVNSSFTLRNLLMRGLIERKMEKGNMYAYEVTFDFLKQLGIGKASELPKYEEYQKLRGQLMSGQGLEANVK
ncbi:SMC-Scp complex subunit ScpB [Candidatus Wolfebacteria bacterium RIFCSPHIGHO2_01_FULL_48_22]|uniref:SMC-Scp complex subunit ScpB n=2 Tax=Candidatus Wolfeibacteriota TaxID=1752735 RepID=A0A1F8DVF6_9BACT|nr:MAG: SMC-Scp complex subunit ScpB [Candidatus Wolfebacteria bacterium RIFCSPHIGHO2_01_FULL_48_22]OGM92658.1 MAG: SMC-Scp complex subunit ScpB [Candidatus Wolfebacteria bacterium RIFCSPLOWO2_01_FULL_47_17b]